MLSLRELYRISWLLSYLFLPRRRLVASRGHGWLAGLACVQTSTLWVAVALASGTSSFHEGLSSSSRQVNVCMRAAIEPEL